MKYALLLSAALALPAFSQSTAINEDELFNLAKKTVSDGLKDPLSAQFRNLHYLNNTKVGMVCGEVNAKNSYGGYVGFKQFGAYANGQSALVKSGDVIMDQLVDAMCKKKAEAAQ